MINDSKIININKQKSIMSRSFFYLISLIFLASCFPQNSSIDFEQAKEEILQLHHAQRKYHFEKDSIAFAQQLSDQHISVNRGQVSTPTQAEHIQRFHGYFESVDFQKWDDVAAPIIRFSEDGKMAYTIVEKEVVVNYEEDSKLIESITNFAWVAIYKKYEEGWKIDCVASTNQPTVVEEK